MRRLGMSISVAAVVTVGVFTVPVVGQSTGDDLRARVEALPGTEHIKAFIASRMADGFIPPRTPWGDPDISGVFDTSPEANTPMERPDGWAGRAMDEITTEELATAIAQRQRAAVERAPFAGGGEPAEGIAIAVPIHWFDNLNAMNARPWWVINPPDGKIPPVTPEAAQREAAEAAARAAERTAQGDIDRGGRRDTYTDRDASDRCITFGNPWRTPGIYGNAHQILQTPDYVVFRSEMIHEARTIPLDGRPHSNPDIVTHWGNSRGYWDGDSLVVETTNLHPDLDVRGSSGGTLRVIERFTRVAPDKVEWTVTMDDVATWTRPWTYSYPMTINEEKPIYEYACHEGNFAMANLLSAGRLADQQGGFGAR